MSISTSGKRSFSLPVVIAGAVSALVLALGMTPTFSAFSASVQNSVNTAGTGTIVMEIKNAAGTVTCLSTDAGGVSSNTSTCATINVYDGNLAMVPGQSVATSFTIRNAGTVPAAAFTMTGGFCSAFYNGAVNGTALDSCAKTAVVVASGATAIYKGNGAALMTAGTIDVLGALGMASLPAGASLTVTITVTVDAAMGNTYQGLKIGQPLTWAFAA